MVQKRRLPKVLSSVIAPIQTWLLRQGRCVGCGALLSQGKKSKKRGGTAKIVCSCGRVFIYDSKKQRYRRALLNEL